MGGNGAPRYAAAAALSFVKTGVFALTPTAAAVAIERFRSASAPGDAEAQLRRRFVARVGAGAFFSVCSVVLVPASVLLAPGWQTQGSVFRTVLSRERLFS